MLKLLYGAYEQFLNIDMNKQMLENIFNKLENIESRLDTLLEDRDIKDVKKMRGDRWEQMAKDGNAPMSKKDFVERNV